MAKKTIKKVPKLNIEDANILPGGWRNFSGRETEMNRDGKRTFCVVIPEDMAEDLEADGWNVKERIYEDEPENTFHFLSVNVSYRGYYPPEIAIFANGVRTDLDQDTVGQIDRMRIKRASLSINPSHWDVNGKSGISAYLDSLYIAIDEESWKTNFAEEEAPVEYDDEVPFN